MSDRWDIIVAEERAAAEERESELALVNCSDRSRSTWG